MRVVGSFLVACDLLTLSTLAFADEAQLPTQGKILQWRVPVSPALAKPADEVDVVFTQVLDSLRPTVSER